MRYYQKEFTKQTKQKTEGFDQINFGESKLNGEILEIIDKIKEEIQITSISESEKNNIIVKLNNLKNRLEI